MFSWKINKGELERYLKQELLEEIKADLTGQFAYYLELFMSRLHSISDTATSEYYEYGWAGVSWNIGYQDESFYEYPAPAYRGGTIATKKYDAVFVEKVQSEKERSLYTYIKNDDSWLKGKRIIVVNNVPYVPDGDQADWNLPIKTEIEKTKLDLAINVS